MLRVLLTGGGTGGHFYPLLAVAKEIKKIDPETKLFYFGPKTPWNDELSENDISAYSIVSSKWRRYLSIQNLFDIPKLFISFFQALWKMYFLMPDVVFSKGGTSAFPVVFAAWFYMIPILIHESDAVPGITNRFSAKFAKRVGISFENAALFFPKSKTAFVGNPVRGELWQGMEKSAEETKERIGFSKNKPLLFIQGGSQGAESINAFVSDNIEALTSLVQVFHQIGKGNKQKIFIPESLKAFYRVGEYLNAEEMRDALYAADLILSRAGSGGIYEIAASGKPSILIPLDKAAGDHQRANAYEYAKTGAAIVIEESNLSVNTVLFEIKNILEDREMYQKMQKAALLFFKPHAAETLAKELLALAKR